MSRKTSLSFDVLNAYNCKHLAILDTSYYNPLQDIEGRILQVVSPFDSEVLELPYQKSGITVINSNSLGISKNAPEELLSDIPDGLYTIKISICPYDQFYYEKSFYRTCKIECKYNKAILTLDFNKCTECFDDQKTKKLDTVRRYLDGVIANSENCNFNKATELYKYANKLLDEILNCDCCEH